MKTYPPIFISGPHGGGKSTLVEKLKRASDVFMENDFDIDFTVDFPSITSLSHFERSLMRLYHRFFIARYAETLAERNPGKVILTNRAVYDSEAYANAYRALGWITEDQFRKLAHVIGNFAFTPHAIVLNPPVEVIQSRLEKRRASATRTNRDRIFKNEDSDEFLNELRSYFLKFKNDANFAYIEDNDDAAVRKIVAWVETIS